ncbi:MAG: hypothetical protein CJBNEKGG_02842 [Prosthecobacter sp.]|nr:hypothetical protein [Prosthecobacter sp.]
MQGTRESGTDEPAKRPAHLAERDGYFASPARRFSAYPCYRSIVTHPKSLCLDDSRSAEMSGRLVPQGKTFESTQGLFLHKHFQGSPNHLEAAGRAPAEQPSRSAEMSGRLAPQGKTLESMKGSFLHEHFQGSPNHLEATGRAPAEQPSRSAEMSGRLAPQGKTLESMKGSFLHEHFQGSPNHLEAAGRAPAKIGVGTAR